jgi:predicted enzyme related to lactoylglutathione lyase
MGTATVSAKRISPMFPVANMEETLAFYEEVLGFKRTLEAPKYAILERDGQTVHFMPAAPGVMEKVRGHMEFYIEVQGIQALWEHVKGFKPKHTIRDLFDRDYGMREFHIVDPNECLVFVGEPIGEAA